MRKIKICLCGASGRMGKEICLLAKKNDRFELSIAILRSADSDTVNVSGFKRSVESIDEVNPSEVDVLIDFSTIEIFRKNLIGASNKKIPIVSGVTGLVSQDFQVLDQAAKKSPILWAPNMSIGVAVLKKALKIFANIPDFDFQLTESHHNKKKDSPSGTAVALQLEMQKILGRKLPEILSIRGGGVVGDHSIIAMSNDEVLEFSHRALNRSVFAAGALRAALWIQSKDPGLFKMEDVMEDVLEDGIDDIEK